MTTPPKSEQTPHIMIIEARQYGDIADALCKGAMAALDSVGATYDRYAVPTTLEIPAAVAYAVRSLDHFAGRRRYDGYVTLGCIRNDQAPAFIFSESVRGLQDLSVRYLLAVGNGIMTVDNELQAREYADPDRQDKGGVAARACLEMIELKRCFRLFPR